MEEPGTARRAFEFGDFRADRTQRLLFDRDGLPVAVPSRAFDVLLYLVQHAGNLIDKASLMDAIWPNTVVEDGNLTQCVFTLRRILGEARGEHRYIVTVPGRGYQFVAPVRVIDEVDQPTAVRAPRARSAMRKVGLIVVALALASAGVGWWFGSRAEATAPSPRSLAVMAFTDLSPAKDMDFLAEGIAEEITTDLARTSGLRVTGRRSAFSLKGTSDDARTIGRKLNVDALVEGSVRKDANRIRVSARLIRTQDGFSLWTRNYDRPIADVLDLQEQIAGDLARALEPAGQTGDVASEAPKTVATRNADAYTAYLRGVYFFNRMTTTDVTRSSAEFSKAVELDSHFAAAHAWRARASEQLTRLGSGDVDRNRALATSSIDRAMQLDPKIADLWWVRTRFIEGPGTPLSIRVDGMERALALSPSDADAMVRLGRLYSEQGRREKAFEILERAHRVDPLWTQADFLLALATYSFKGDSRRTEKLADEIIAIAPDNPQGARLHGFVAMNEGRVLDWDRWTAAAVAAAPRDSAMHGFAARDYGELGVLDAALYHARMARELSPENATGWGEAAIALMRAGKPSEARVFVDEALAKMPNDDQSLLALAELQYFEGDCAASVQTMKAARPSLAQPGESIAILSELVSIGTYTWCLRQTGDLKRANEMRRVVETALKPPLAPGLYDGLLARMAAAVGDREALVKHLAALANTRAVQFDFSMHEPMIQPWVHDPAVRHSLDAIETRRAEWRGMLPKASLRVQVPTGAAPVVAAN